MAQLDAKTVSEIVKIIMDPSAVLSGQPTQPNRYDGGFLRRAGVPKHRIYPDSSSWICVSKTLEFLNRDDAIDQVVLRAASPLEYPGDPNMASRVIEHLNRFLIVEGLQIVLEGVQPALRRCVPSLPSAPSIQAPASPARPSPISASPPDFARLLSDQDLSEVLLYRWREAERCTDGGAYLSAIVMMGSILEGLLRHQAGRHPKMVGAAKHRPRDRAGNAVPIGEWGLSPLIEVAHEVGWLRSDVRGLSHALREARNMIHPGAQRLASDRPDERTCSICWQIVGAAVADLLGVD